MLVAYLELLYTSSPVFYCQKLKNDFLRDDYLGSGLIKGVGPITARKIVKHFGEKTLDVFDSTMDRLTEVPGIAKGKLDMIRKAWTEHQEIRNVMLFLQAHQISTLFAVKIYKMYGNTNHN